MSVFVVGADTCAVVCGSWVRLTKAFAALMALTYVIMSVMAVTVWGPNLALRGNTPGDMERAVAGVKKARGTIYVSFFVGITLFIAMATTVAWIQMSESLALSCTVCSVCTFVMVVDNGVRTRQTFRLDNPTAPDALRRNNDADDTARSTHSDRRSYRSSNASSASTSSAAQRLLSGKDALLASDYDDDGLRTYESNFSQSRRPAWATDGAAGNSQHDGGRTLSSSSSSAAANAYLSPQRKPLLPRGSAGAGGDNQGDRDSVSVSRQSSFSLRRSSKSAAKPPAAAAAPVDAPSRPSESGKGSLGQTWPPLSPSPESFTAVAQSPSSTATLGGAAGSTATAAAAASSTATTNIAGNAQAGNGQGLEHERESQPDEVDLIASRLAANGGGWIQKRDKSGAAMFPLSNSKGGWKRRWVSVRNGVCYYSKSPPSVRTSTSSLSSSLSSSFHSNLTNSSGNDRSSNDEGKALPLKGFALSVGSDGLALRLSSSSTSSSSTTSGSGPGRDESGMVVDWRCESPADCAAWVAYFQAGISASATIS